MLTHARRFQQLILFFFLPIICAVPAVTLYTYKYECVVVVVLFCLFAISIFCGLWFSIVSFLFCHTPRCPRRRIFLHFIEGQCHMPLLRSLENVASGRPSPICTFFYAGTPLPSTTRYGYLTGKYLTPRCSSHSIKPNPNPNDTPTRNAMPGIWGWRRRVPVQSRF